MNKPGQPSDSTQHPASAQPDGLALAITFALADAKIATLLQEHAPMFALRCADARIIWATRPAADLFGATDLPGLQAAVLRTATPGAERLARLAQSPPTQARPRLERLRFAAAAAAPFTCLTQYFPVAGGEALLLVAVLGMRSCATEDKAVETLRDTIAFAHSVQAAALPAVADAIRPVAAVTVGLPPVVPQELPQVQVLLAARFGARRAPRIVWQTNAVHVLTAIGPELALLLDPAAAPVVGDNFADRLATPGIDPSGEALAALADCQTFSGIITFWPACGSHARVPVRLGATPQFDKSGAFVGYRGFGSLQLDEVEAPNVIASGAAFQLPVAQTHEIAAQKHTPAALPPLPVQPLSRSPVPPVAEVTAVVPPIVAMEHAAPALTVNAFQMPADVDANDAVHLQSATYDAMRAQEHDASLQPGSYGTAAPQPVVPQLVRILATRPDTVLLRKSAALIPASDAGGGFVVRQSVVALRAVQPKAGVTAPLRPVSPDETVTLTSHERQAFRDIARALGAQVRDDDVLHVQVEGVGQGVESAPVQHADDFLTADADPDAEDQPVALTAEPDAKLVEIIAADPDPAQPPAPLHWLKGEARLVHGRILFEPLVSAASETPDEAAGVATNPTHFVAPQPLRAPFGEGRLVHGRILYEPLITPSPEASPAAAEFVPEPTQFIVQPPLQTHLHQGHLVYGRILYAPLIAASDDPLPADASMHAGAEFTDDFDGGKPVSHLPDVVQQLLHAAPVDDSVAHHDAAGHVASDSAAFASPVITVAHDVPMEAAAFAAHAMPGPFASPVKTETRDAAPLQQDSHLQDSHLQNSHLQDNHLPDHTVPAVLAQRAALVTTLQGSPAGDDSLQRNAAQLLDRLPVGVVVCRGAVPLFVNDTQLGLLGYETAADFYAHGGLARMFRGRQPDALDPGAQGGAVPIIAADGEVLAVDARLQTINWDGLPATLITFRKAAEPEAVPRLRAAEMEVRARESELRELHAILDTATDGVAVIDDGGRILSLNRSAQAVFGYDQNELVGEPFTLLFATASHGKVEEYFDRLKGNGPASVLNDGREVSGRERQGGTMPLYLTLGRIGLGDKGKFCAVLRDLTQFRRTERELSEARKQAEKASALKSDFLAKVSHEIRTPLNCILGFTEVIMDERLGPIGNDRYKEYLKDIHSSGSHVLSLVNDLLDLSKIEAGKADMNFIAVDANRVIAEAVALMQPQAAKVRVIMRQSLAGKLPSLVADERSLRQIVLNLLSNAIKFTDPGGQIIVSTTLTESGNVAIRVKDTGIGMSEDEIGAALEPFRQIATTRKTTGTGLGLPLTKALIEANRASMTIKSRRNEGTLVEVMFPSTRVLAE